MPVLAGRFVKVFGRNCLKNMGALWKAVSGASVTSLEVFGNDFFTLKKKRTKENEENENSNRLSDFNLSL